jgi:hypothetical protein
MANVFVGSVGVRIRVSLGIPLDGVGAAKIRYEKPDGVTGTWTAVIENASMGVIYYDVVLNDINVAGTWKFNGIWDPLGDNYFIGATACLTVREPGDHC